MAYINLDKAATAIRKTRFFCAQRSTKYTVLASTTKSNDLLPIAPRYDEAGVRPSHFW